MPPILDDAAIERLASGLLDGTLPKAEWTHAAHFAATLWLLRCRSGFDRPRDLPDIIRRYNVATGGVNSDDEGYHHTITLASLRAAGAALALVPGQPLAEVLAGLLAGPPGHSGWLMAHWSRDRLFSARARREWVDPDLVPLPF